jgi:hypothetical protein
MAIGWTPWYAELVSNIRTAVPEVKTTGGGGIHDVNEMERMTQERITAFPYAVVELAAAPSGDWGITNSMFEVRCEVTLVAKLELGMPVLRTRIDALRAQFLSPASFTTATCLDCIELELGPNNRATAVFLAKNIPFIAAAAIFTFIIGEQIT